MSGSVAGLGSITPAAGFVTPLPALFIGCIAAALCYYAVSILKSRLKYDDTLDVFGIHGIAGTWGVLATGLFASVGAKGLFYGNPGQFGIQVVAVLATIVFCGVLTFVILKLVDALVGLRVAHEQEVEGLDISQHEERGYNL